MAAIKQEQALETLEAEDEHWEAQVGREEGELLCSAYWLQKGEAALELCCRALRQLSCLQLATAPRLREKSVRKSRSISMMVLGMRTGRLQTIYIRDTGLGVPLKPNSDT